MATVSTTATNPPSTPKIPYNVATDFTPIINIAATPNVDCGHPTAPSRVTGMLAAVKREPGKVLVRLAHGNGSITHPDDGDVPKLGLQTSLVHVPHARTGPDRLTDAVAGRCR